MIGIECNVDAFDGSFSFLFPRQMKIHTLPQDPLIKQLRDLSHAVVPTDSNEDAVRKSSQS